MKIGLTFLEFLEECNKLYAKCKSREDVANLNNKKLTARFDYPLEGRAESYVVVAIRPESIILRNERARRLPGHENDFAG